MTDFGPTGQLVFDRTYSRVKPNGERETWEDTVQRVVDGNLALVDERHQLPRERERLTRLMNKFKVVPAGRQLWATGVKGRQYLYNCFVSGWEPSDPAEHFRFTFMRLMEGGGVGANYSNRLLSTYPPIETPFNLSTHIVCDPEHPDYETMREANLLSEHYVDGWGGCFQVEDSREGWAEALVDLIRTFYRPDVQHYNRVYDVSRVRASGAKLKTYGGYASGPAPLAMMLHEVAEVFNQVWFAGEWLTGMDAMDIDHAIAQCVVAGGNRRSARMSIMHWNDPQIFEFLKCKTNTGRHWSTNISVEVDARFREALEEESADGMHARTVLGKIAEGMLRDGEPGIWDSSLSNEGEPNVVQATNPCLTGDTAIATVEGARTFADLAEDGKDVQVYSWDPSTKRPVVRWMRRPHKTRVNTELLKVTFDSGLVVRCTPDHSFYTFRGKKVQAKDLMGLRSKSIRAFSASRDGSGHERVHGWDSKRNAADHQWTHRMVWENEHGPIDDGMVVAHLDHNSYNNELSNLAVMTPYEHASYDYPLRLENGFYHGSYPGNHKVVSVEPGGFADVYNGMVEGSHTYIILDPEPIAGHMSGIVSANCGEIPLEPWEACNLGHVNLAAFANHLGFVDFEGLYEAHQLMTRFLIRATFGDRNDESQSEVMDRNRRIGLGHFGFAEFVNMLGVRYSEAPDDLSIRRLLVDMADVVDAEAIRFAHDLRIPVPVKKRTVAPTGTIAKLPGTSEGIHPIFAKHFIRRIRFSNVDPEQVETVEAYRAMGYHVEPCVYAANTSVVSIPTKDIVLEHVSAVYGQERAEEIVESADDLTLNEMLDVQEMYQTYWADNAVSYTANIDPEEYAVEDIEHSLRQHLGWVKGYTVFPELSREQSPYERISKEEYESVGIRNVQDSVDEECASGAACPIK